MGAPKKVPLADIIEKAANEHLKVDAADRRHNTDSRSCCAVYIRTGRRFAAWSRRQAANDAFERLIRDMGMVPSRVQFKELSELERQQVRYAWLMLVAQVARERGIEV